MTDAKPIEPSTERVANTVAFLLRFSKDYENLRDERGAETPLTEMLEKLNNDDKEKLYKKACETIAEMDEAMKETPSLKERATEFLKTRSFQDIKDSALRAATEARQAANRGIADVKKAASQGMDELNKFANSEEVTAAKDKAKETISKGFSGLQSLGTSMYNRAKNATGTQTQKETQGGKRKNKTKKLTKKEKKMKRARK